jgi:hypothetical protein
VEIRGRKRGKEERKAGKNTEKRPKKEGKRIGNKPEEGVSQTNIHRGRISVGKEYCYYKVRFKRVLG